MSSKPASMKTESHAGDAYRQAGVDVDAGEALVERLKPMAKSTLRPGAGGDLGGFGGLFDLKATGFSDPVLVSGTDGVGTKLKIAIETGIHHTVGIDLVAMCANDVLAQGAEPLFFLDYFATGTLDIETAATVIGGIAEGCRQAGCALIGGETAEMPGMYAAGDYDLAGFCVGAVERDSILPRLAQIGDVLIGLPSHGLHANGFSLVRKIIADQGLGFADPAPFAPGESLGAVLLEPTRLYVKAILPHLRKPGVRGFAHITGGGLTDNIPRVLPSTMGMSLSDDALSLPPLFEWLQDTGGLDGPTMRRTFNCGIGGVLVVADDTAPSIMDALFAAGEAPRLIGAVIAG